MSTCPKTSDNYGSLHISPARKAIKMIKTWYAYIVQNHMVKLTNLTLADFSPHHNLAVLVRLHLHAGLTDHFVCFNEPPHDKTKMTVCPVKTQISLGIHPVWSESSLCTQLVAKDPSFLHADSEDSDQTGRMPRLIWVFTGRTCHLVGFAMKRLICCLKRGYTILVQLSFLEWTSLGNEIKTDYKIKQ